MRRARRRPPLSTYPRDGTCINLQQSHYSSQMCLICTVLLVHRIKFRFQLLVHTTLSMEDEPLRLVSQLINMAVRRNGGKACQVFYCTTLPVFNIT